MAASLVAASNGDVLRVVGRATPPVAVWVALSLGLFAWLGLIAWVATGVIRRSENPLVNSGFWMAVALTLPVAGACVGWVWLAYWRQARLPDVLVVDRAAGDIRLPRRRLVRPLSELKAVEIVEFQFASNRGWPFRPPRSFARMRTHLVLRLKPGADDRLEHVLIDESALGHSAAAQAIAQWCGVPVERTFARTAAPLY